MNAWTSEDKWCDEASAPCAFEECDDPSEDVNAFFGCAREMGDALLTVAEAEHNWGIKRFKDYNWRLAPGVDPYKGKTYKDKPLRNEMIYHQANINKE